MKNGETKVEYCPWFESCYACNWYSRSEGGCELHYFGVFDPLRQPAPPRAATTIS